MEPPSYKPSSPVSMPTPITPKNAFLSASQITFFGSVRELEPSQVDSSIKAIFSAAYPSEKMTTDTLQRKIQELTTFLKDPQSHKTPMGDKLIDGAIKVMAYIKANSNFMSSKEVAKTQTEFTAAAERYHIDYTIEEEIRKLIGEHNIPENFHVVLDYIRSLPASIPHTKTDPNPVDRNLIFKFLDAAMQLKLENIQILEQYDGKLGKIDVTDPDVAALNSQFVTIRLAVLMSQKLNEANKELVQKVFENIFYGSTTRSVQTNSDTLQAVLPMEQRTDYSLEREQNRSTNYTENVEMNREQDAKQMEKINQSSLPENEKKDRIQTLDDRHHYIRQENFLYSDMAKWSPVILNKHGFFAEAERTLGYMSLDQAVTIQRTFRLDLSKVELANKEQVRETFNFLTMLSRSVDSNRTEEWMKLAKSGNTLTLKDLEKCLERDFEVIESFQAITTLSPQQKLELLKSALPFNFQTLHFLLKARLELSTKD